MKYTSPIGRIVQGNPLVPNPQVDKQTGAPRLNKQGQQKVNWYANVAFEKANPKTGEMIAAIFTEAARCYPALFPFGYQAAARQDTQPPIHAGGCIRSDFAFKLKDGDGYDANGKPHAAKEGWAGCWIVQISTYAGALKVVNGLTNNSPVTEVGSGPNHIKTGDFVVCCLDINTNGWTGDAQSKPGIFIGADLLQINGFGTHIVGGPDPDTLLQGVAAATGGYTPAGMSTSPVAAAAPNLPTPMQLPGAAGTLPPQALPAVAAAPKYKLSPEAAAAGYTKEALNGQGHTDESLIANGYLVLDATPAPALPTLAAPAAAPALPSLAPALPVIPNHALVQQVLATPQYVVAAAVAAQGHTLESLTAAGHTIEALLTAGYITKA